MSYLLHTTIDPWKQVHLPIRQIALFLFWVITSTNLKTEDRLFGEPPLLSNLKVERYLTHVWRRR